MAKFRQNLVTLNTTYYDQKVFEKLFDHDEEGGGVVVWDDDTKEKSNKFSTAFSDVIVVTFFRDDFVAIFKTIKLALYERHFSNVTWIVSVEKDM